MPRYSLEITNAVDHAHSAFVQFVAAQLGEPGDGAFRAIPYSLFQFAEVLSTLDAPGRFLDVGCGLGSKLLEAQAFGWDITGLEIYPPYAEFTRQLLGDVATIITIDAYDYLDYDQYDLVHMWWPREDEEDQANLERLVESRMRRGAIAYFAESVTGPDVRRVK